MDINNMSVEQLLERVLGLEVSLQEAQIANATLQRKLESCFYGAKSSLLRILGYVDRRSLEALRDKKVDLVEVEKIIIVGLLVIKNRNDRLERNIDALKKDYGRSTDDLKYIIN